MSDLPRVGPAAGAQTVARQLPAPAVAPTSLASATEAVSAASEGSYAGIVTRTIAFVIDVAIVEAVAALVGVTVGLGVSILYIPHWLEVAIAAILGVAWVIWSIAYFAFFWSTTGQTPGNRVMGIRVIDAKARGPLKPHRAVLRFGALCLAALPLFAGFLMMLWDDRCRCLQDRLARTLVVYTPTGSFAGTTSALPGPATPTAERAALDLEAARGHPRRIEP